MEHERQDTVASFAELARTYCDHISGMGNSPFGEWLADVHVALAEVYHAGLLLPDIAPDTADVADVDGGASGMFIRLRDYLGEYDVYRGVWDPHDLEDEAILAHLSDDLSDVCGDFIEGLALAESGAHTADVLWHWRESFRMHWGRHAADALRVIHDLRYSMWI